MTNPEWGFETRQIHAGQEPDPATQSRAVPIYQTTSYTFRDSEHAANLFGLAEVGNIYTRIMNPTQAVLEARVAALEGAPDTALGIPGALATSSGQAAETLAILNLAGAGDHIVASASLYGGTYNLLHHTLPKYGIDVTFVNDPDDLDEWRRAVRPSTKAFFGETIGNPRNDVLDLEGISALAHEHDVPLIVDNTVASPYLIRPLEWGADIVVHSATKFIDGQGRCLGGVVAGSTKLMQEVVGFLRTAGPTLSPFNAWLFLKGLETLKVRMQAHCAGAQALAEWLEQQPQVTRVYYAGLPSHPQHELARRQQSGFGAVVSFEVRGGKESAWQVIDATRMISITTNLGDTKTTIAHPASTSHGRLSAEARASAGISDSLIRVSVGLEDIEDIKKDLARGLALI